MTDRPTDLNASSDSAADRVLKPADAGALEVPQVSPADPAMVRVNHARITVETRTQPQSFFDAFTRWADYKRWAPRVQGPAHWLLVRRGGSGSRFVLYDKPGPRHLVHFGVVTDYDRPHRFAWRAPFSEWNRAYVGTELDIVRTAAGARVTETFYVDVRPDHLPVMAGFLALSGFSRSDLEAFLEARIRGLDTLVQSGAIQEPERAPLFTADRVVAADWAGRMAEGDWVRVIHADGEVDLPAPPDVVFPLVTRWARYADWTRDIHVGAEWYQVRKGGIGSRFLLWEKPGDRHVMHYGTFTEFDRNRHFAWRAPFAEWGKVFIGTSMYLSPRADGGTRAYHAIWVDLPRDYLAVFAGFGTLHGFDLEFETWHIHEEMRGFTDLLRHGAFSPEDRQYLFDEDQAFASDWPAEDGRPSTYAGEELTVKPSQVLTYEELSVVVAEALANAIPGPRFFERWRDQARMRRFRNLQER